ncbi:MAG: histidine kinase [Bacteroidia bacterium]|nr:histidine kinase [Bacteroidia bacterium]
MYKFLFALTLIFFIPSKKYAQKLSVDSMKQIVQGQVSVQKMKSLLNLSSELKQVDRELGEAYAHQGRKIALRLQDTAYTWLGHVETSFYKRMKAEYDSAILYATESLRWAELLANERAVGASANELGKIFARMDDPEKSIYYNKIALQIAHQTNSNRRLASYRMSIGNSFYDYFRKTQDSQFLDSASFYYEESASSFLEMGDSSGYFQAVGNQTNVFRRQGAYQKALEVSRVEYAYYERSEDVLNLLISSTGLSTVLNKLGKHKEALYYDKIGERIADSLGDKEALRQVYSNMKANFHELNDFKQESETWGKWSFVDSMLNDREMKELSYDLEAKYKNEKQAKEIVEKELEINAERIRNRNAFLVLGIFMVAMILTGLITYFRYRFIQKLRMQKLLADQQKKRFSAVMEAQERERTRIAMDLHDGLGQLLSAAKMNVSSLDEAIASGGDKEDEKIYSSSVKLLDEAAQEVRQVSHNLMPIKLKEHGLIAALKEMAEQINSARETPMLTIASHDFVGRMEVEMEISVYRICQEIINNSLKHSGADKMSLDIKNPGGKLEIVYKDNGKGLSLDDLNKGSGIGWSNIQLRAELIGASLKVESLEQGARIQLYL